MAHPCIKTLQRSHLNVTIQSKGPIEDACALMHAKHLAVGSISTFSQSMNRFNADPGVHYDPFGPCEHEQENTTGVTCTETRSISYCVEGIHQLRQGQNKVDWMLNYQGHIRKVQESCDTDLLMR
uniref:Uncharacterized protein n=2 Tax=Noctiluca scintillans TaxID=2966 RepID=A0A7S1FC73_NOCSC|mmetsp:Transcript_51801/g.138211  ORF Transcript_51801/g.138211 Transcript_51801/m.138211 type:complete len:125 (+) Transcript_51801:231-605(+)